MNFSLVHVVGVKRPIDATRLAENLFVGSFPARASSVRRAGFDVLVLAAKELQPPAYEFSGVDVIHAGIDDARLTPQEAAIVNRAALAVVDHVKAGKKVLVTCAAGRNRSALIAAIALMQLKRTNGFQVVRHIRSKRKGALTNPFFTRALIKVHERTAA